MERAHEAPFTVSSDFARTHAIYIAIAASEGLITVLLSGGHFNNRWVVTERGVQYLMTEFFGE